MKERMFVRFYVLVALTVFALFVDNYAHAVEKDPKIGSMFYFQSLIDNNSQFEVSIEFNKNGKLQKHTVATFKELKVSYFEGVDTILFKPVKTTFAQEFRVKWYIILGGEVIRFDDILPLSIELIDDIAKYHKEGWQIQAYIETECIFESELEKIKRQKAGGSSSGSLWL